MLKHIGESAEQVALLQTGTIDIAQNLTVDDIQMLGNDPEVQIFQTQGSNVVHLTMNLGYEPFASSQVRDALRYAIDYDGIITYVLGGAAIKQQGFIRKGLLGYTPAMPYSRDLEKARQLLAEGGYPEGFELELNCPDYSPWLELAMKIKEDLSQIGVIVQIVPMDNKKLGGATYGRRDFQMFLWQWWDDYPDTDANAKAFAHCYNAGDDAAITGTAAWSAGYVNPETSKLVEQAAQELDPEKRRVLYEKINALIVDDGPFVFLYNPIMHYAVRTEIIQSVGAPEYSNEFMLLR
jgi:peptide/nickel transport system substrate-binding protein